MPSAAGRTLSLDGCRQVACIDAGLTALRGLARVAMLNLQGCVLLTDEGLGNLAHLTSLVSINLQDCKSLTGAHTDRWTAILARDAASALCPAVQCHGTALHEILTKHCMCGAWSESHGGRQHTHMRHCAVAVRD